MKKCNKCLITKEDTEFYLDYRVSSGRESICKECRNKYFTRYANNNRERKRLWFKKGKDKQKLLHPEKIEAREALGIAVKKGLIKRANCFCGNKGQAHHHKGYGKRYWLDVIWLCSKHHKQVHIKIQ